ncbi:pyridoxamine 5'-phosphate oxidase family protein [Ktedonobacter racemifer]|uniref:Pyridoxamine 5'-phosphate oxidase-related FMN-binding protein n=1 Tax=Ktedonobacter racemifer DSM 44963 TaxID=485913 RepID=D6TZ40_KTERA|nr:pyridoxamine 5'-phosphate oxidase family protein [Ktedonobacter racemifer]EFH81830.1 pyridoxamine 5'-phosphate oxidase-related FMN-binding protein [Ktedonobacter racemifer DSM 44963]
MDAPRFQEIISSEEELRELLGFPSELVVRKQLSALDEHCYNFIAHSPFLLLGTASADGHYDVSPRGDAPGFVQVLDEKTLLIPERPGNRRLDSLRNILQTSAVGLLFLIPGVEEILRVNGRAQIIRDRALLERMEAQGKLPLVAIALEVEECFMHCAKAAKRSHLWDPTTWPERTVIPSLGRILVEQIHPANTSVADMDAYLEESYRKRLY